MKLRSYSLRNFKEKNKKLLPLLLALSTDLSIACKPAAEQLGTTSDRALSKPDLSQIGVMGSYSDFNSYQHLGLDGFILKNGYIHFNSKVFRYNLGQRWYIQVRNFPVLTD